MTNEQRQDYEQFGRKESFDPLNFPVWANTTIGPPQRPVKVLFLTQKLGSGKVQHVFLDGMNRSKYIEVVDVISLPTTVPYVDRGEDLWMDDSPITGCSNTEDYAKQQGKRKIPILHLDFKDFDLVKFCPNLYKYVGGKQNLRYVKRSIVEGRKYNWTSGWVDFGHYIRNIGLEGTGGPLLHGPYVVRTDQVELTKNLLLKKKLFFPMDFSKKKDVSHFWGFSADPVSFFRNQVTVIVKSLEKTMRVHTGLAGARGTEGRRNVQERYIQKMMESRIVVVTQRDKWEGYYRLMEALASGSMVVADFMLSLPKGLVDRESVVLFRSEQELKDVLLYYNRHEDKRREIARRGWEIAMGRHRSWHRMEDLLFGMPLTDVGNPYDSYKK
jgi:hypothetical protein